MINDKSVWSNPYRGTAQDGIRTGRQDWRELHVLDAPKSQLYAVVFAFVMGTAFGVALYVLASGQ